MGTIQITKKTKIETKPSDREKLIESIKTLKKGQCLEYRGSLAIQQVRSIVGQATCWLLMKYSAQAVEGGIDIYCE